MTAPHPLVLGVSAPSLKVGVPLARLTRWVRAGRRILTVAAHPADEEGHGIMRLVALRGGLTASLMAAALASCGAPAPSSTPASARPTASALPRPSAAAGPCASVLTTTPISQVPAACAALWAPYGVTKVPPANLTDATPPPPPVINRTNGSVSDGEARIVGAGVERAGIWYAVERGERCSTSLTPRIEGSNVVNAQLDQLMRQGDARNRSQLRPLSRPVFRFSNECQRTAGS